MSGSEDGQLRSPGNHFISGEDEDHDTDSLDIKPPQAVVSSGVLAKRKEKLSKDKKHSKEHKQRGERDKASERDRDKNSRVNAAGMGGAEGGEAAWIGGERERRQDFLERRERKRDARNDADRYHGRGVGVYERGEELRENERGAQHHYERSRFQKHYERAGPDGLSVGRGYHHNQQQQYRQVQMHRQRQEYYERSSQHFHHMTGASGGNGAAGVEYHISRHQQYVKLDYAAHHYDDDGGGGERERKKYNYDSQKDAAENLEQDLRSRLLSKRHKYVKSNNEVMTVEELQHYNMRAERGVYEDRERERDVSRVPTERQHDGDALRHDSKKDIIELLDSPDDEATRRRSKKHKHRNKEKANESKESKKRPKSPEDPELLLRREKLLVAEREKEKLKETAREELEARRELRTRERIEKIDELSPSAVAASVTAGLHVVLKRKSNSMSDKNGISEKVKRKRTKRSKMEKQQEPQVISESENDADDDDEEEDNEVDSDDDDGSESVSGTESELSYKNKKKKKHSKVSGNSLEIEDSDSDLELPESPLSIGELPKSPQRKQHRDHHRKTNKKHHKKSLRYEHDEEEAKYKKRQHTASSRSVSSQSNSDSNSSRSRSPAHSHTKSLSRSHSRSRSSEHSASCSNSLSDSSPSYSSRSRSRTRSRSHSQEKEIHSLKTSANHAMGTAEEKPAQVSEKTTLNVEEESPACDDNGVPLPNYYPGVQGCRSVEEFQCLNRIEEGTYGVVYRAKDKRTNEIVALKRLKMEKEKEGFPITSLREINTLLKGQHPNIVTVREIVVGSNMDKIFIVMDYVEHDLKSLMETMKNRKQSFFPGEVKCLIQQLLRAVGHLHDNWILHRDLKTSNLLLSHKGILKVGDFGLAREYGSPLKHYTSLVVTLWYRAPELLLCSPIYSTPIDIWSVGCIFAEFLQMAPLFPGKSEIDELNRIFKELGTPNEKIWPGYKELPAVKNMLSQNSQFTEYPISNLRKRFSDKTTDVGISLLQGLLTYDPKQRLTAEAALKHAYFKELPLPIDPSMFPTWPAKSELGARKAMASSPKPPSGGSQFKQLGRDELVAGSANSGKMLSGIITGHKKSTASSTGFVLNAGIDQRQLAMGPGFNLKF